jgi:hypothetical protein
MKVTRTEWGATQVTIGPRIGDWPLFCGSFKPGLGWFRIFGAGLSWKDAKRHGLMFSERNGFSRRLRIGSWGIGAQCGHGWLR